MISRVEGGLQKDVFHMKRRSDNKIFLMKLIKEVQ